MQNCNIFNDGAWTFISDRKEKPNNELKLEHGKPLIFGANGEKGIALNSSMRPEVVDVAEHGEENILVHDETNPAMAYFLSRLTHPDYPTPVGVFRCVEQETYDSLLHAQINEAVEKTPGKSVQDLIENSHIWEV